MILFKILLYKYKNMHSQMYDELCRAMDDANENEDIMLTVITGNLVEILPNCP